MKSLSFVIAIVLFVFCACKQGPSSADGESKREILYKEVMQIHNEVMPKMADLNRTNRGLKAIMAQDSMLNDSLKTIIETNMLKIESAEQAMEKWMQDFKTPKSDDEDKQVIEYLEKEKEKISEVSDLMLKSLNSGNELLNSLQKKH